MVVITNKQRNIMTGFKLVSIRKDGSIGSLFMNKKRRLPIGEWMEAENHQRKGFALRPGWHITAKKHAPHLSPKNRVWVKVEFKNYTKEIRPKVQGGLWYLAQQMKIVKVYKENS